MSTDYTFTQVELRSLLRATLARFVAQDDVYDFSPDNTAIPVAIDETMASLEKSPLMTGLPFDGSHVVYETEDNINAAELGLEVI